ncbi:oxidase ustYa family protein [Aspergillus mulundensis]|uniref:Cyclochlorotine biosynthesis protein O n=1 Tax=Aspergillus mulundensis TaxID=1810919 RepID=A0A3D8T305_9EURO|nr:Uncharacterized protein DSM5745_00258 [Aspergillus mulundensis]RDW92936.1 Uncharacterized protein DSM5745_00258 [Aspergillus mulundensis]
MKYQDIPENDSEEVEWSMINGERHKSRMWQYFVHTALCVSVLINVIWLFKMNQPSTDIMIPNPVFSPANRIVQYRRQTFSSGFDGQKSPYMGPPSEAYDKAWEDLYNYGIIKIPTSDAAKLVNHTLPLSSEPGNYVVEIDVFHQLHCLHHLHKKAWGHEMGVNESDPEEVRRFWTHLDHCSESLRQSLMCSSDVAPITWVWSEEHHRWQADGRVVHTCRDFEAIREWAFERTAGVVDFETWVPDPLKREV